MKEHALAIQPLNQCLYCCTLSERNGDQKFYMIDASDADHVITKLISLVEKDKLDSYTRENAPIVRMEDIILDWESDLMNQNLTSEVIKKPIRGFAMSYKFYGHSHMGYRSCFMWNGVNDFNVEQLVFTTHLNENGIAFVDGHMLMSDMWDIPCLEKSQSVNSIKLEKCGEITIPTETLPMNRKQTSAVVIPCSNILNRDYSLSGFFDSKDKVYLYNLTSGKFDGTVKFIPFDNTFKFHNAFKTCETIPYLEGNRLRVFLNENDRLYEITWKGDEFNSDLIMIRHLEWIEKIEHVLRIDHSGLLIRSNSKNYQREYHYYNPQPYNPSNVKSEGLLRLLPKNHYKNLTEFLYAPKTKCLISFQQNRVSKSLTLQEIEEIPSEQIKNIFDEEEYLEMLKVDTSFKTYTPRHITDACEHITNIPYNPRISEAYQFVAGRHADIEIVAGIGCKKFVDKLGDMIATDYIEIKPRDFADYLGAPVIYQSYSKIEYTSFIKDMVNESRSSNGLELVHVSQGSYGLSNFNIDSSKFWGILSCKPKQLETEMKDEEEVEEVTEKEYERLFKDNEFFVETTTLIATDPLTNDSGVQIRNARPGIWKWKTTHKTKDTTIRGLGLENANFIAQLVAIHKDYYDEIASDPKLWFVPDNAYRKLDRDTTVERHEFYEDEIEGGWFVMKLGVGVEVAMAGIFDEKYFNNEKCLQLKTKPKSIFEQSFKLSYNSEWQDYFCKRMEKENYPSRMAAPYGIMTSTGHGDGCYLCLFKKSKGGDVIAVRLIFC